jgi:hypothetical protein
MCNTGEQARDNESDANRAAMGEGWRRKSREELVIGRVKT